MTQRGDAGSNIRFHAVHQRGQLGWGAPGGYQLRFEVLDPGRPLLKLHHKLRHVIGQRDGLGEPLLLHAHARQVGLEHRDVLVALRELRLDLGPDLADHHRERLLAEHVRLQLVDQRGLDLFLALVDGHRADRVAAVAMPRAPVGHHAFGPAAERAHAMRDDRAAARRAARQARERVLGPGVGHALRPGASGRELLVDGEPGGVIDDAPLRDLGLDDLARVGLHAADGAGLAQLLDAPVQVDAPIPDVEEDRAYGAWRPRPASTPARRRCRDPFVVQAVSDLLQPSSTETLVVDPPHDRGFGFVHTSDRVLAARAVALALQAIAVTAPAGNAAIAHPGPQRFSRARPDGFELHLVASALNERGGLVDRIRELNLLATHIIEETTAAIAHQVADYQGHLDRIATKT